MVEQLGILQIWAGSDPDELHREPSNHENGTENPEWDMKLADGEIRARATGSEIHVHHCVCDEKPRDRVPRPRIHPPSCQDEGKGAEDPPASSSVWDDHHSHINCVALLKDCRDNPQHLRGKCPVSRLDLEIVRGPKCHEDGVEVCKRAGENIKIGVERVMICRNGEVRKISVAPHGMREDEIHDDERRSDREPESKSAPKYCAG